jgi:preprotein translocase subunit Sss1
MEMTFNEIIKIILGLLVVAAIGFGIYLSRDYISSFFNNLPT